jgi:UPF0755 protein
MSSVVRVVAVTVAGALVAGAAAGGYLLFRPDREVEAGRPVHIVIGAGFSTSQIAGTLSAAGVITNALRFRVEARFTPGGNVLKAGAYDLTTDMPDGSVLSALESGPNEVFYDVPIPEGFTVRQIAARLAARAHVPAADFLPLALSGAVQFSTSHPYLASAYDGSLEGYLFPATYRIKAGSSARQVIEMMLDKFDAETAGLDLSRTRSRGMSLSRLVTLASILERETKLAREYPLVSSVIYNRLARGMRLQLDSTVFYEMPAGTVRLTSADLRNPSSYNTYVHAGLPPGPLCNPGSVAIQAAARPAKTDYYYYVLTGRDGSQTFTTTYAAFLRAVTRYHQVFGQ